MVPLTWKGCHLFNTNKAEVMLEEAGIVKHVNLLTSGFNCGIQGSIWSWSLISGWREFISSSVRTFTIFWSVYSKFVAALFSEWDGKLWEDSPTFLISWLSLVPSTTLSLLHTPQLCVAFLKINFIFWINFRFIEKLQIVQRLPVQSPFSFPSDNILCNLRTLVKTKTSTLLLN